ncbi:MAG TPA: hypothetical protein VIV06_00395 [Candidatus Limnocylindrales bacterium]
MPLRLSEPARRVLLSRGILTVQAPTEEQQALVRQLRLRDKRAEDIPFDVLFALESLRQLAEQGNEVAADLYESERIRLGIDRRLVFEP